MIISVAPSVQSKSWKSKSLSWDEMVERLKTCTRTRETVSEYSRMSREDKGRVKDAAGCFVGGRLSGKRRVKGAVVNRCLITLDADEAYEDMWEDFTCVYGGAAVCYSTHSSTPDKPRLRFVLPLSREVSPEEYEAIARRIGRLLGLETLDKSTFEHWRAMYWPSVSVDGTNVFRVQEGEAVDADAVLAEYGADEAWRDVSLWPMCPGEAERREKEERIAGEPTEKPGMVGLFCRTYDIDSAIAAFLPEIYEEAGAGRYTYTKGSTHGGAVVYGDGAWLYSNHATDPAGGQLCNAWDLVRIHLFGELDEGQETQDINRRRSQRRMEELAAADTMVRRTMAQERAEEAARSLAGLDDTEEGAEDEAHQEATAGAEENEGEADFGDLAWAEELKLNSKTGECECSIDNALLILRNDPHLKGRVGMNLLCYHPAIRGGLPWRRRIEDKRNGDRWTDTDDSQLRAYMEKVWRFTGKDRIQDAWNVVVDENAFHPVREYLDGQVWDGTERLDTLLIRHMDAVDNEYVRAVTRKWMVGAVKRVYEPGCQFDAMLLLYGGQGIGKSRLGRILSRGWFSDSLGRMDSSKDAYERLNGVWIAEVAELAAAKRSEIEDIKNFLTKTGDVYRAAYERHTGERKRQCVFYGTTNTAEMLRDSTGNRRFWVVEVQGRDHGRLNGLEAEVDQLWAEAVVRYRAGESLWLDEEKLMSMAEEVAEAHTQQDDMVGYLQELLDKPIPVDWDKWDLQDRRDWYSGSGLRTEETERTIRRTSVCIAEIRYEMMGTPMGARDRSQSLYLADIMAQIPGWKSSGRKARRPIHGLQRVYLRTK